MDKTLFTENEIDIEATANEVWKILTDPEKTKRYMYGCEVISDWNPGDPIIWKGAEDKVVYVKGNIITFEPGKKLSFTVFDPNANYDDLPENYLTVVYTLNSQGNQTRLHVTQGDYSAVQDGEKRYQDTVSQGGWQPVLEGIKDLAEK